MKSFNVAAARKAGYSDSEIQAYIKANSLQADMSGTPPGVAAADVLAGRPEVGTRPNYGQIAKAAMPFVGAALPSVLFPEAGIPMALARAAGGAVLGGGLGDAVGSAYGLPDESNSQQLRNALGRAEMGAGTELGGRAISGGANFIGKALLERSFKPNMSLNREFRTTSMGDAGNTGMAADRATVGEIAAKERAPVQAMRGQVVSDRVMDRVGQNGKDLRTLLAGPRHANKTFTLADFKPEFNAVLKRAEADPLNDTAAERLRGMWQTFEAKYGNRPLTATDVLDLKQAGDVGGIAAHRQAAKLGQAAANPVEDEAYKALGNSGRRILNTLGDPKVRALNSDTQRLLFLAKAAVDAEARTGGVLRHAWAPALAGGVAGGGTYQGTHSPGKAAAVGLTAAALLDPVAASRLGLAMTGKAASPAVTANLLRALGLASGGGAGW